jgi:hypothetical protein
MAQVVNVDTDGLIKAAATVAEHSVRCHAADRCAAARGGAVAG